MALAMIACHRTAPQSPSRRSGKGEKADSTVLALMEGNRRLVDQADKDILAVVDSVQKADKVQFAQMSGGGWKMRRDSTNREIAMYSQPPKPNENWRVRIQTFSLNGKLIRDMEGVYTIKHYDMPLAVEEAVDDMFEGETAIVYSPWYTAYGTRGTDFIAGYENVRFVITLVSKE